jgi:phosphoribosyl-ATP pyrophosphohydrolase
MPDFTLQDLEVVVWARKHSVADVSYTKSLLDSGTMQITKKLGEEAVEVVIAANAQGDAELKAEVADLLFHTIVLLAHKNLSLASVMQVLEERTKQSGHKEKAERTQK